MCLFKLQWLLIIISTIIYSLNSIKQLPSLKSNRLLPKAIKKSENNNIVCKEPNNISLNAFDLCICGALATIIGDFVMHPIDTIKIVQQAAASPIGILDSAKLILKLNGPFGFYQGVAPYLLADGISGAVKFATFELSREKIQSILPAAFIPVSQFVCAAFAFITCSVLLVPGEVIKTKLQAGNVKSLSVLASQIYNAKGLQGFFTGYYATLVRDVPYTMLELGIYENTKILLRKFRKVEELSKSDELLAAAFTGGVTGFITTPLDLIKTKLMMQAGSGGIAQYTGIANAFSSVYEAGGMRSLFVGSAARVAWLLPFTTIYLGAYETIKKKILEYKRKQYEAKNQN